MAEQLSALLSRLWTARSDTLARLSTIREADMLTPAGVWRNAPVTVRFQLYRLAEHVEEHLVHLVKTLQALGFRPTEAQQILGQAQITRGELESHLVGIDDTVLDTSPGDEEWPLRRILGHLIAVDMRYCAQTAAAAGAAAHLDETALPPADGEAQSTGTRAALFQRLRSARDAVIAQLSDLNPAQLEHPSRWARWDVNIRLRLLRFAAHEREHTIHIIKTLRAIGHQPTEAHLILGRAQAVQGQLEARLVGVSDTLLAQVPPGEDWSPRQILEHLITAEEHRRAQIEAAVASTKA